MILACDTEQYIEPFLHYVRFSEYQQQISVTAFSKIEAFMQYMDEVETTIHVLLAERSFVEDSFKFQNVDHIFYLVDEHSEEEAEMKDEIKCIYKYQPLSKLLASIINSVPARRTIQARGPKTNSTATLVTIYSAQGGAGKTTVALNLSRQFSMQGIRVFYFNLENIHSSPLSDRNNQATQGLGLSRLLYDLKRRDRGEGSEKGRQQGKMQEQAEHIPLLSYIDQSNWLQVGTFSPVQNQDEVLQMEAEDVNAVIDFIMSSGLYDIVIVDVECEGNTRTTTLLERCDQLIWLVTEDWSGFQKAQYSWSILDEAIKEKTLLVLNKHSGHERFNNSFDQLTPSLNLSFIAGWSERDQATGILNSPDFQRDILQLCQKVYKQENLA